MAFDDLTTVKDDMVAFIAGHGMRRMKSFVPEDVPDCCAEENLLRTSGRGLFLMRAFMDEFRVQKGFTGGAEVVMAKKLPHSISGNGKH